MVEDYVQHISGYDFKLIYDPEVAFGKNLQYQNRISLEFNHAYHWHPLVPSVLTVEDSEYTVKDILFKPGMVLKHGFKNMVEAMTTLPAGRVS